ncbi:MAG: hypothetical protein K6C32_02480 [Bacilli bacterium]|nr:hypothetical protein [Bacilli bacterium]
MPTKLCFIDKNGNKLVYEQKINEIEHDLSPFKQIVKKEDFSSYSLIVDDETKPILLKELFHLKVNVKNVATFNILFRAETFNKQEAVEKISPLKEMDSTSYSNAIQKVKSLLSIINALNPLFYIVNMENDSILDRNDILLITNDTEIKINGFILKKQPGQIREIDISNENIIPLEKPKPGKAGKRKQKANKPVDYAPKTRALSAFDKFEFKSLFKYVKVSKFHLCLSMITSVLLGSSLPLAIFNVYEKNGLAIFLFACAALGAFMSFLNYYEHFKKRNFKDYLFIATVTSNVIGLLLGIGVFFGLYSISTKSEGTPGVPQILLLGIGLAILVHAITIVIAKFVPKRERKKKEKAE